ncbi:MAG: Flp pilus assembly protein CpaB [Armatimonadota bacterium]
MKVSLSRRSALVVAFVAGSLAALSVYVYVARAAGDGTAYGSERIRVVTAATDIRAQSLIKSDQLTTKLRPRRSAPAGAATEPELVVGRVALANLPKGQVIRTDQIAEASPSLGLAHMVPEHMRAITVGLDPVSGVAGFLKPGNHVDVLATITEDQTTVTITVLQDVELLALGQRPQPTPEDKPKASGKPSRLDTQPSATLAVTPEQAQRLFLAESKGKLRLALRSVEDHSRLDLQNTTDWQVTGLKQESSETGAGGRAYGQSQPYTGMYPPWWYGGPVPPGAEAAPGSTPAYDDEFSEPHEVEVIRGSEREVVTTNE